MQKKKKKQPKRNKTELNKTKTNSVTKIHSVHLKT